MTVQQTRHVSNPLSAVWCAAVVHHSCSPIPRERKQKCPLLQGWNLTCHTWLFYTKLEMSETMLATSCVSGSVLFDESNSVVIVWCGWETDPSLLVLRVNSSQKEHGTSPGLCTHHWLTRVIPAAFCQCQNTVGMQNTQRQQGLGLRVTLGHICDRCLI